MSTLFLLAQTTQPATVTEPIAPVDQAAPAGSASNSTITQSSGTAVPATQDGSAAAKPSSPLETLMFPLLIGMFVLMFVLTNRAKKKEQKQKQAMLHSLKRGDRVQTVGGIMGTVVEATPEKVLLKVDETSNTKISFSRNAIDRVIVSDSKSSD